jgi:hypothetical protein
MRMGGQRKKSMRVRCRQRPEAATSGLCSGLRVSKRNPETYGSLETTYSLYPGLGLVARAESRGCKRPFYERSNASVVMGYIMFAEAVIGDSDTVVIHAAKRPSGRPTGRLKENTGIRKRGEKPIGKPKSVVEWAGVKKKKKSWMMRVQHHRGAMVMCTQAHPSTSQDADFVAPTGSL